MTCTANFGSIEVGGAGKEDSKILSHRNSDCCGEHGECLGSSQLGGGHEACGGWLLRMSHKCVWRRVRITRHEIGAIGICHTSGHAAVHATISIHIFRTTMSTRLASSPPPEKERDTCAGSPKICNELRPTITCATSSPVLTRFEAPAVVSCDVSFSQQPSMCFPSPL